MSQRTFVQIGDGDLVVSSIVLNEEDCLDLEGNFSEQIAQQFIAEVVALDGEWIETNDLGLRVRYAGIGMKYERDHDCFCHAPKCDDAVFDEINMEWLCPEDWDIEFLEDVLNDDTLD